MFDDDDLFDLTDDPFEWDLLLDDDDLEQDDQVGDQDKHHQDLPDGLPEIAAHCVVLRTVG